MSPTIPEDCLLALPAEVTPELAQSCPDKMNLLFQVQLLGRSINDTESALRLLLDLAREFVPYDRAALFWQDEANQQLRLHASRGFGANAPAAALRDSFVTPETLRRGRTLLVTPDTCQSPALQGALQKVDATSLMVVPLYIGQGVVGALLLLRHGLSPFLKNEAHLMRVFTFTFESVLDHLLQTETPPEHPFLDRLTGLFNNAYFEQQLERELDRARRTNEPLSVLVAEVDDFAQLREQHGHVAAEALIHAVAGAFNRVCRKSDTLVRYRDHRFAVIMPRTGKKTMGVVAQRVFASLAQYSLTATSEDTIQEATFSLCAVAYPDDALSAETLLEMGWAGLNLARTMPGRHYYQYASHQVDSEDGDILDMSRAGFFREAALTPTRLLPLLTRLALDTIPADRVSLMVRDQDQLVVQVAFGFEGQEEIVQTTRVPLTERTVSAWVAQNREPLLVDSAAAATELPLNRSPAYRSGSFFSYPLLSGDDLVGVIHFSDRSDGQPFSRDDLQRFAPLAEVIARFLSVTRKFTTTQEAFLRDSLCSLVALMEHQVPGMEGHSAAVADLAGAMAARLGYDTGAVERIRTTSLLQNLGTVAYRSNLLAEERALTPRERALTQRHPLLGWKFLEGMPLHGVDREAILYHHEREDGSGYMHKKGEDIPHAAKILAAADVFGALTEERPYRPALNRGEALRYLRNQRGTLFAADVVDALATVVETPAGDN